MTNTSFVEASPSNGGPDTVKKNLDIWWYGEKVGAPLLFALALIVLWEVTCRVFNVPEVILPTASATFSALWEFREVIWQNALVTLWTTLVGFLLAIAVGLLIGVAVGWHRAVYSAVYPILIAFNSIPKVAVVPVLILWFGLGTVPAILTAFLISFFPIVVNVATGLATVEPELEDVLRALGASKLTVMTKVGIPRSLPHFFGSLKVAITLAFIGAVVAETSGASSGLGKLMLDAQAAFQVPIVFAALIVLSVLGILLYAVTALIEQRYTGWAHRSSNR
ncbi:ABC transporter permease [Mesorhizobium sp. CC13]|uniref:ABC transporter permease n=1 Tax=Mesorhizobium sp. CC13 TaxID=3029194 RepID=UPI00326772E5